VRAHQSSTDSSKQKLAITHQPPLPRGGMRSPYSGAGGSSASQGNWRIISIMFQLTEDSIEKPTIQNHSTPKTIEAEPSTPR